MAIAVERRNRKERRLLELGPPNGWLERRKHLDRRLSEVEEAELSPEEFVMYFGASTKIVKKIDHT